MIRILDITQGDLEVVMTVVRCDEHSRHGQKAQKCGEKLHDREVIPEKELRNTEVILTKWRG